MHDFTTLSTYLILLMHGSTKPKSKVNNSPGIVILLFSSGHSYRYARSGVAWRPLFYFIYHAIINRTKFDQFDGLSNITLIILKYLSYLRFDFALRDLFENEFEILMIHFSNQFLNAIITFRCT